MFATKRLQKELIKLNEKLPPGITLVKADDLKEWLMDIQVMDDNPIYKDETYRLKFTFSGNYPIEAPEVVFTPVQTPSRPIPLHPHIYSNGIICLDMLAREGWSPVHNVESVCVSLQSMLTSNTKRERPEGDDKFVKYNTRRPKDINFVFHDNGV
ncbi:UBC-like protein [Aaosphaeria arxii CBS 175.79]|uniref:Ubiquitin-conjugating enzyme E2 2 n=1 Tax=Aaosphaeria arxii CBS 175.79 TaxID=1450172 RepID=A0A6A5XJP2_9PLEO|nr:UBC-like protein [Aaosphaeria arxii CBS 175.79]KAF2013498.1 UBC-like protein [Aaosphaeria arxii CBS 175.79]